MEIAMTSGNCRLHSRLKHSHTIYKPVLTIYQAPLIPNECAYRTWACKRVSPALIKMDTPFIVCVLGRFKTEPPLDELGIAYSKIKL
jgi:hypothetical protein